MRGVLIAVIIVLLLLGRRQPSPGPGPGPGNGGGPGIDNPHMMMHVCHSFGANASGAMPQLLLQNRSLVRPGDHVMLVEGNFQGSANARDIETTARVLKQAFPTLVCIATTNGLNDVRTLSRDVSNELCPAVMNIWEVNDPTKNQRTDGVGQWTAERIVDAWKRRDKETYMRATTDTIEAMRDITDQFGKQLWWKPHGQSTVDKGSGRAGICDYGVIATLTDGQNIQSQGSVESGANAYRAAVDGVLEQYRQRGINGGIGGRPLFMQTSVGAGHGNSSTPSRGIEFAKYVWDKKPRLAGTTLWWFISDPNSPRTFYQSRQGLF